MNDLKKKSLEEHTEYLYEIVRVKLHFLYQWLQSHPDETLTEAIRERVDIYRKTDINTDVMNPKAINWEHPRWQQLENELSTVYDSASDADDFEEQAFAVIRPMIDGRVRQDYEERPYVLDYKCGSLTYDKPREDQPQRVGFHIANALQPKSIFADPEYLPHCLQELIRKSREEYGASELGTFTWLNAHPRWLGLFPESYATINASDPDENVKWHFGYWGQFITARGTFNIKLGAQLRETGIMPFMPRYCWCTFDELEEHLIRR